MLILPDPPLLCHPSESRCATRLATVIALGLTVLVCLPAPPSFGQQLPNAETAAAKLLAATVTVRISPAEPEPISDDAKRPSPSGVSVCSGVALGQRNVVTFCSAPLDSRFRVTLPDGEQSTAELRVADTYSGLVLLELDRDGPSGLAVSETLPPIGGAVVAAAAAGIEPAVVSLGILGGVDRTVAGARLPPMLQCDIRTTDTSSGAPLVDRQGRLIGVVAATPEHPTGWSYALPARHVQRLVRVRPDQGYRLLRQQRPTVGFTLRAGSVHGTVEVEHVEPGGPADQAGVARGDLVHEAEGRKIRSPYQAVALFIRRQPGDTVDLKIEKPSGETKAIAVTLGGVFDYAVTPPAAAETDVLVGPQLEVRATGKHSLQLRSRRHVQEVSVVPGETAERLPRDEAALLRAQLVAFEKVIGQLQNELQRRDAETAKTQQLIQSLTGELAELRKQLDSADPR